MDDNLVDEIKSKSNQELKNVVINFNMHRGALVAAAKTELTNRGIELSVEEQQKIEEIKNQRIKDAINNTDSDKSWNSFSPKWKINIVDDIDAPQLYSRKVINAFSILFSVLFGGILLAINLKNINNKKAILPVLFSSLTYIGLQSCLLNLIPAKNATSLGLCFNLFGGMILSNYVWGKYIGKDFKYRTKPFWIPLIIGIIITVFVVYSLIMGKQS